MTGYTPLQLNSPFAGRIAKINVPRAVVDVLRELGHEVDGRLVEVGESVELRYDLAFINVAPVNALNGRMGAIGSLWTMTRKLPTIVHFDDWQFQQVFNGLTCLINHREKQLYKKLGDDYFYKGNAEDPELPYLQDEIFNVCARWRKPWDRWLALCPMYQWGDKSIVLNKMKGYVARSNFAFFDPTSLVTPRWEPNGEVKERAWACASVMSHQEWLTKQGITWPIHQYGTNKTDVREGRTQTLATEEDVQREYAKHRGILSPVYPQSGSGWWRSRFIYGAQVGSVVYCGSRDGAYLGDAYCKSVKQIEALTDAELDDLARQQHDALMPHIWSKDQFICELDKIIQRAVQLCEC
jgi:hypothetical protein